MPQSVKYYSIMKSIKIKHEKANQFNDVTGLESTNNKE